MAHRLDISPSAYGSIERGETKLSIPRLEEIAKMFEIDLAELIDPNERNIFNFGGTHSNHCQNWYCHSSSEQLLQLQHELEKARLQVEYLTQQNADLREMVNLLKSEGKGKNL